MLNPGSQSDNAYAVEARNRKAALGGEFYSQFAELAKGRGGLILLDSMFKTLKALLAEYDNDFIAQLLFPEHYPPARYPIHFPIPTCVFETVEYGFLRANNQGCFSVVVYPKRLGLWPSWQDEFSEPPTTAVGTYDDNVFMSREYNHADQTYYNYFGRPIPDAAVSTSASTEPKRYCQQVSPALELYNTEGWNETNWGRWKGIFPPDDIHLLYQQIRLTACCVKLTYMGRLDVVSGYLSTSLDYKHNAKSGNSIVHIDYGLYKRVTHPLEGARAVWYPKDKNDEEFEDVQAFEADESLIWGTKSDGGYVRQRRSQTKAIDLFNSATSVYDIATFDDSTNPITKTGLTLDGQTRMDTDAILMYGIGLPTETGHQFRVELIRHWEGIPLQKFRQYLYGERPFTSQKGYDALKSFGNTFPMFSTMTAMEAAGAKDVVGNRINELDAGGLASAMASRPSDIVTTIANNLG